MRLILAVLGIAVLAMVGVAGFDAALTDNADRTTITNETWTPDAGNVTELNDSNLNGADYNETVTVYNASDVEMDDGSDYEWFDSNGTVKALQGGDLENDSEATITYSYLRPPEEQVELAGTLSHIPQTAGLILPMFALVFLLLIFKQ